jgi:hybrid cluster-associated redox disulfide protein
MSRPVPALRARVRAGLRARLEAALAPRDALLAPASTELAAAHADTRVISARLDAIEADARRLGADLAARTGPFRPDMTIDQAWRRHPGAPAVFARFHLPACDGCAVRFDESVEEAAAAYGLDLRALLAALDALLPDDR